MIGGRDGAGNIAAGMEIYNPATGTFSGAGRLITGRLSHTATLLPNGKILVVGGNDVSGTTYLTSTEMYDPASGASLATGTLNVGRYGHAAILLNSNKVLVVGGANGSGFLGTAELFY